MFRVHFPEHIKISREHSQGSFRGQWHLSGTGDSQRDSREWRRIDSRESFAVKTPTFIARQADSHESLEFPIRANHPIRANRAKSIRANHATKVLCGAFDTESLDLRGHLHVHSRVHFLREGKPGDFQTGGFPTFFGKGPDCVADPSRTVPRRCC